MKLTKYWRRKRACYIADHGRAAWDKFMRRRRQKRYWKTPKGKYQLHKNNAKQRGIPWEFTFERWWRKWSRHPEKWAKRGNKKGQYVMARIGDAGPYSEDNTIIVKSESNAYAQGVSSGYWSKPKSDHEIAAIL